MPRTKENPKPEEFRRGMSYIENSTLGLIYGSPRTHLGDEKTGKLAFLFTQLKDE